MAIWMAGRVAEAVLALPEDCGAGRRLSTEMIKSQIATALAGSGGQAAPTALSEAPVAARIIDFALRMRRSASG
ncbi:hypothetical protein [Sphingomonas sp. PP-CE-1G-424]|uniref:hypothetical protein n=1 Tax=Sphingomonas sp. PP-CE-1G-424 TaxID=2135658 RepID=UPI0010555071|nr:hypothetical protein [Sphingomonas sp. PP-CE-1G-424]